MRLLFSAKNSRAAAASLNKSGAVPQHDPQESTHMNDTVKAFSPQDPLHFVREGFVTFTPAQASLIMDKCLYKKQRRIDRLHAMTLRELMARGQWAAKDKIDFARMPDGKLFLINGNHRMTAQGGSHINIEWTVVVHDCATMADVQALYYRFDTNVRKRSDQNIMDGIGFAEMMGVSKTTATALFKAVPIIANNLRVGNTQMNDAGLIARRLIDERITLAESFTPAAKAFEECQINAPKQIKQKLRTGSFMAVALVTFYHQPENAKLFWQGLCDNDGLRRGDPRATLLLDMSARKGNDGSLQQNVIAIAKAWNAFTEGRQLKIIKVVAAHTVPVNGTPYTVSA